jgi:hypothetical protein
VSFIGFVVVHEWETNSLLRHDAAGSIGNRKRAFDHLGYCQAMQSDGKPGTEGRYFVAEVREVKP